MKISKSEILVICIICLLIPFYHTLKAGNLPPLIKGIINSAKYEKDSILLIDRDDKNSNLRLAPLPLEYYEQLCRSNPGKGRAKGLKGLDETVIIRQFPPGIDLRLKIV